MTELNKLVDPAQQNDEFQLIAAEESNRNIKTSEVQNGGEANLRLQHLQSFNSRRLHRSWMVCCGTTTIIFILLMCIWIVFEIYEADV